MDLAALLKKNFVLVPVVASVLVGTFTGVKYVVNLTDTINENKTQIENIQRDITSLTEKTNLIAGKLERAEGTWEMAENLYEVLANKVNRNPSLAHNENFALLVSKCRGVIPTKAEENRPVEKNTWKGMKKEYLEANPDAKTMDNTTLKMPPKDYILPLPKPKDD